MLLFLLDVAAVDGRNPYDDLMALRYELQQYDPELIKKKYIIVANKLDIDSFDNNYLELKKKLKEEIIPISCETKDGIPILKKKLLEIMDFDDC